VSSRPPESWACLANGTVRRLATGRSR
jgi:hypothetical protein